MTKLVRGFFQGASFGDLALECAAGATAPTVLPVNKFGRSTAVDQIPTDIWDYANVTQDQPIWLAPTAARIHNIASTSPADDGNPAGLGAQIVRVFGLTSWSSDEVSEDVTLNGVGAIPTGNAYVIIHRMFVVAHGATNINVGIITATAVGDLTVTAAILAGSGQTQMAIYGVPSTRMLCCSSWYAGTNKQTQGATAHYIDMSLLVNFIPDTQVLHYRVKQTQGLSIVGSSQLLHEWNPYYTVLGPAIIKIQAIGSVDAMDVSAGFDGYLRTV